MKTRNCRELVLLENGCLYKNIYEDLLLKIENNQLLPGEFLPSEKQLCNLYDCSLFTVRRSLKMLQDESIIIKVKGKGSKVNDRIRADSKKTSGRNVGFVEILFEPTKISRTYGDFAFPPSLKQCRINNWSREIYNSFYEILKQEYTIILGCCSKDEFLSEFENSVYAMLDKIVLLGGYDKETIDFLHNHNKLVVTFNNMNKDIITANVVNNERESCYKAIEYLISRQRTKIACINGDISYYESTERYMGYQEALFKNNIPIISQLIKWGDSTAESGYYLATQLILGTEPFDAIFCVNDNVAEGAIRALLDNGLRVPEDVFVVGHDNNAFLWDKSRVPITTIDPQYKKIAKELACKVVRKIWLDDTTQVRCKFIVKSSTH